MIIWSNFIWNKSVCFAENVVVRKSFRMNRDAYKKQFKVRYYREHFKEDWKAYGANGYLFGYENYLLRSRYLEEKLRECVLTASYTTLEQLTSCFTAVAEWKNL